MLYKFVMFLQKEKASKVLNYCIVNISAWLSILMITEPFAICPGTGEAVLAYQMVSYIPQAVFMVAAPFLSYMAALEPIPNKGKAVKLLIIGILFTVSMLITIKFGIPILESVFGSIEKKLIILPIVYYSHLGVSLMGVLK